MGKAISVVVPVYNEKENVANLHAEIKALCESQNYAYEIIMVDDGSKDGTWKEVAKLSPVTLIRLRRNFGQTAAMDAGIKRAKYDYIVTMDGDGQNDPKDIPNLVAYLEENDLDVVSGWRKYRKDTFFKKFVSRGANFLRSQLIHDGIQDSGCSLKIYKKECFDGINLYGEMHRFIPAILKIRGFTVGEIVVNHRPRTLGKTKYNWRRTVKGFIDMLSVWFWDKFEVRPLHLLGGAGLFFIMLSVFTGSVTVYKYLSGAKMSDTPLPLITTFTFLSGIQFFISGLLADSLIKNLYDRSERKYYSVKEVKEIE